MTPRRLTRLAFGSLALAAILGAAFSVRALAAPADEPEGVKNDKNDKKELIKDLPVGGVEKTVGPSVAVTTQPSTRPATGPATQPAAAKLPDGLAPEVKQELDAVGDAYRNLKSLRLAGTISAVLDVGERREPQASFESSFQAPNKFRNTIREGAAKNARDDSYLGSSGDKLWYLLPQLKYYLTGDAPKDRTTADKLGKPFSELLAKQNPGLLLALCADPVAELARGAKSITRADDVKVGDTTYTVLKFDGALLKVGGEKGGNLTVLIDPKTHLVRRFVKDVRSTFPADAGEVKRAEIVIDYATIEPDADVKPEQFAWAAPQGGRDAGATPLAAAGEEDDDSPANALEGKPAPDFKLTDADGKEVQLSDLKGTVVLLDFWATWCGPCRASLPHLDKIYGDKKGDGLKAYAVNQKEDPEKVGKFVEATKLGIPVLFDSDGKVAAKYAVTGIPQTVVVGKDGTIKKVVVGSGTHDAIRAAVEEAMK